MGSLLCHGNGTEPPAERPDEPVEGCVVGVIGVISVTTRPPKGGLAANVA
jgi:hypothetical protein